jgi:hypothetical protein
VSVLKAIQHPLFLATPLSFPGKNKSQPPERQLTIIGTKRLNLKEVQPECRNIRKSPIFFPHPGSTAVSRYTLAAQDP